MIVVAVFALAVLAAVLFFLAKGAISDDKHEEEVQAAVPARGVNRMQAGMRRRRAGARAAAEEDDEAAEDEADVEVEPVATRRDAYEARRAAKEAEREAQEAAQEEEIRRAAEERRKKEEEEAAKWMSAFTLEAAGEDALSKEQDEQLLDRMVEYIKKRKTVAMEDVAAEFNLKVVDAISRVQSLEAAGRITGVMDDRGKFIFVGLQEMEAVAEYIRSQGRISIADLASKSNTFIDLAAEEEAADLLMLDEVVA